jgi:glycyl-tRNA synthetase beta subunit
MKKWPNELNRASKEQIQMAKKLMKKCSTFLARKGMQIKTLRFYFTPVRMAIIKNTNNNKYW